MSNTAIVVEGPKKAVKASVSIPKLRDDYILVKVKAVALNPTDWKGVDFMNLSKGARVGCDYAGVVEEVGSKVTKPFKKGDRVAGFAHGGNEIYHEDGSFANYITAKGDIQIKIPDNLSFEEASTLGVGITTVGQALYQSLDLPLPSAAKSSTKPPVLIYAASTATGALAVQFAVLSGCEVIATCSPHNNDYVKSLGATAVFDYNSPSCASDIKARYPDIKHVFDCISEEKTAAIAVAAMSSSGGTYTTLLPVPAEKVKAINDKVEMKMTLAYTIVGEAFKFSTNDVPAQPENFEFGKKFWEVAREALEKGEVKVHRPAVNKYGGSGFEGILAGLQRMREGKVSGEKLVYTL